MMQRIRAAMAANDWQQVLSLRQEWGLTTGLGFPDSKHDGLPPAGSYGFASPAAAQFFFDAGRWLEGFADQMRAAQQQAREDTAAYFQANYGQTPEQFFSSLTPEARGVDPTKAVVNGQIVAAPPPAPDAPAASPVMVPALVSNVTAAQAFTVVTLEGAEVSPPAHLGAVATAPVGSTYADAPTSKLESAAAAAAKVPAWVWLAGAVVALVAVTSRRGR